MVFKKCLFSNKILKDKYKLVFNKKLEQLRKKAKRSYMWYIATTVTICFSQYSINRDISNRQCVLTTNISFRISI